MWEKCLTKDEEEEDTLNYDNFKNKSEFYIQTSGIYKSSIESYSQISSKLPISTTYNDVCLSKYICTYVYFQV